MKSILPLLVVCSLHSIGSADILIFAQADRRTQPMDTPLLSFISNTLQEGQPSENLDCEVKTQIIREDRRFSDGVRRIEMLEVIYFTRSFTGLPEQKSYFPLDSKVTRSLVNSRFAGSVEEIQLEAEDTVNSRFIFQHNGRGEIVWMSYEDDLKTVPCRLKRR